MALVKKRSSGNRTIIIGVVIVIVVGVGYLLYQQYFINGGAGGATNASQSARPTVITNYGESILNDSRFTQLRSYGSTIHADANVDGGQTEPFR